MFGKTDSPIFICFRSLKSAEQLDRLLEPLDHLIKCKHSNENHAFHDENFICR